MRFSVTGFAFCAAAASLFTGSAAAHDMAGAASEAAPYGAPVDDQRVYVHAILDQFEERIGRDNSFRWEGEGWVGTDTDRLWLKSEGELNRNGKIDDGQHEVFYDRPITSFFDLQAGARFDIDSHRGRTWAALGVEGLAPLFFHVSATGYASNSGHFAAKLESSYDLLLTQRLILQPRIELNLYSKSDPMRLVGSGLSDLDAGLRLRYEFSRKFAPYIGLTYENKFGETANLARLAGERPSDLRLTIGIRSWL